MTQLAAAVRGAVWFLGALTLVALLDRFSSYLELLTFFRVQYAALLLVALVIALVVRLHRVALAAIVLAGVNLAIVAPTWVSPRAESATRSGSLTLLLLNLQSDNDEQAVVARLIGEANPDVVGLVELTPIWAGGLAPTLERFPHRKLEPERGAYGIGLYSRLPFRRARIEHFPRDGPASIVASLDVGGEAFTLVLTHVHTPFAGGIHRRQFEALAEARERLGERLAICGDLNSVPWSSSFRHLVSAADLTDSHRGHWIEGSWPSWGPLLRVPIDNCLVGHGVTVLERAYGDDVGSDHLPLVIRFGIDAGEAGHARPPAGTSGHCRDAPEARPERQSARKSLRFALCT